MRAVLRPVPEGDPRPTLTSPSVARRAAEAHTADLVTALQAEGQIVDAERAAEDVTAAITACRLFDKESGQPAIMSIIMELTGKRYRLSTAAIRQLAHILDRLPYARRLETLEWSQRMAFAGPVTAHDEEGRPCAFERLGDSGRPPCAEGDRIEWLEPGEVEHLGEVVSVSRAHRTVVVRGAGILAKYRTDGKVVAWEAIYANATQGLYAARTIDGRSFVLPSPELIAVQPAPDPRIDPTKVAPRDPQGPRAA